MSNIKNHISKDGYPLYSVEIDENVYYLANINNYSENIQMLIDNIDEIFYDAVVLIFGIDSGCYIDKMQSKICEKNKVIIIEPNEKIYEINVKNIKNDNVKLIQYNEDTIKEILEENINYKNVNRIIVHCFGNYQEIYSEEYDRFIELLEDKYYRAMTTIDIFKRLREMFFRNILLNLPQINNATPINSYININSNIPAIIVSAGPSLDRNIEVLIKYRDKLDKFFIIANNRTVDALIRNNIKPNLIVSLDPKDEIYEMMKNHLNIDVPLAFYEHSNSDLLHGYTGEKIYIAEILPIAIDELKWCMGSYTGGSVAHCCIDFARIMGCNPIILAGQDCALTFEKNYSDNAHLGIEEKSAYYEKIYDKDIYGEDIKTTPTLNFFKKRIEEYINMVNKYKQIDFINVSYGANIEGAPHRELEEVIVSLDLKENISTLKSNSCIKINSKKIIDDVNKYINYFIDESDKCIKICEDLMKEKELKSLIEHDENDENLIKFIYVLDTVDEFEECRMNMFISSYITKFLFEIKQKCFEMLAIDYDKLSSDFKYQSSIFFIYFTELKSMFTEVRELFDITVAKMEK